MLDSCHRSSSLGLYVGGYQSWWSIGAGELPDRADDCRAVSLRRQATNGNVHNTVDPIRSVLADRADLDLEDSVKNLAFEVGDVLVPDPKMRLKPLALAPPLPWNRLST